MGETFLICIHDVSANHPYAILRTSIYNTSKDVIKQIFMKTQRYGDDEKDFVLIEELGETSAEFTKSRKITLLNSNCNFFRRS